MHREENLAAVASRQTASLSAYSLLSAEFQLLFRSVFFLRLFTIFLTWSSRAIHYVWRWIVSGAGKLIYSGLEVQYVDQSSDLQPYTAYQYSVSAFNSKGQVSSPWASVRTTQAAPTGIPAPVVLVRFSALVPKIQLTVWKVDTKYCNLIVQFQAFFVPVHSVVDGLYD